ncbi:MAG: tryptophan 7-halogenase [Pyrinomonadaceae bacterium]|nr:tryptophan 7-halogenase [Pyrinomonadaceae bacterium]
MPELSGGSTIKAEVCVIGGGPAGAALALRLVQLGHTVVVVEKQAFPRQHVGESLVGSVLPLLDVLGVRGKVESAGFLRPEAMYVRWADAVERRQSPGEAGFQVDRGRFDELLLQAAEKAGARLLQPARAVEIKRLGGGWRSAVRCETGNVFIESRFIADATGRTGLLPRVRQRLPEKTLALYAYWNQVPLNGPETRIDTCEDGWYWGAPLPGGEFNATVFIDASLCRKGVAQSGNLEKFYESLIARSELLSDCLKGSRIGNVRACDATPFYDDAPATADAIKVGEAAFSIDPLSSQGVQTAIGSALHAAVVLHTIQRHPKDTSLALDFYRMRQLESVALHRRAARKFYGEAARTKPGEFWQARAAKADKDEREPQPFRQPALSAHTLIRLSPEARCEVIPSIQGDFVTPATAITFPGVAGPIAFLDGIEIGTLAAMIQRPMMVEHALRAWTQRIPLDRATTILRWLWERGIVVAH